jgi:DNA invertase Pin-like site-specific DNA recombinase
MVKEEKAMSIYGYCRISRKEQSIDRQVRNIKKEYPRAYIIKEAYTGTRIDRPEWNKLYKRLKSQDIIVFDSVSRMSRNAEDGFKLYEELYAAGVELVFIKEPHINTATYKKALENNVALTGTNVDYILEGVNKYLMALAKEQIVLAFAQAQKEVDDLHQRTKEGIETARLNGKQIGQRRGNHLIIKKEAPAKEKIIKYSKDFSGSLSDKDCIRLVGVSRNTYYKYKMELKAGSMEKRD